MEAERQDKGRLVETSGTETLTGKHFQQKEESYT